tara:strand:- start:6 stop:425 length:420 start_codon:yes stop_codon:yes gene_type:complete
MVKVPEVDVLLDEKSNTATALLLFVLLYIKAPIAVMVAVVKLRSAKSVKAVVPDVVGATLVSVPPPVAYVPLEATSPVVVNAVVAAPKVAVVLDLPPLLSAYNASLKALPFVAKLCVPNINSCLNAVHIACAIAITVSL